MSSLAGLVANYGDSDEEHDEYGPNPPKSAPGVNATVAVAPVGYENAAIHPPPIAHCPWSACYDDTSGFTYYWNQHTNAVTWEAPPEYLLALKVAQQQLNSQGSAEVSAEEWQLYQQALAEKQSSQAKSSVKTAASKSIKKIDLKDKLSDKDKKLVRGRKRAVSDDEDEKIELITSYHNSDSESNDEESPAKSQPKPPVSQAPKPVSQPAKPPKRQKKPPPVQYGPPLPPNLDYTVPIGPELPPEIITPTLPEKESIVSKAEEKKTSNTTENDDSQDESLLLRKLKDKAKILEKLGGEIPTELKDIINDESTTSRTASPSNNETKKTDIDDLLAEIEKKELPKVKSKVKVDIFDEGQQSNDNSAKNSPRSNVGTPPREEIKPLFPSSKAISTEPDQKPSLFPSAENIETIHENGIDSPKTKSDTPPPLPPEKRTNIYLSDSNEASTSRKKFRISNSVLPERSKADPPSYTTKYSSHIEGFSSERTGLGFSNDDSEDGTTKETISYGKGLMFTKGETLNEEKKDEELDDLAELVEAKLKYLNQVQPSTVTPVQEMLIQMQTLLSAWRVGALGDSYFRRWVRAGAASLTQQEAAAAPPGWTCAFQRSAGRYQYVRAADGLAQWDYPLPPSDMDISTTPPHPGAEQEEIIVNPPLPPSPPPLPPVPPPPAGRPHTPPPPAWHDPPPPGTDDAPPPLPSEPPKPAKQEIGDELASFYSDLAELEKHTPSAPHTANNSPERAPLPPANDDDKKEKEKEGKIKKKTKVKISSSIGMKHKSVSSLVAKWQQVAEEINSD